MAAFAVSMLTFDAFSFIQVTFMMFVIAALGACAVQTSGPWRTVSRAPRRGLVDAGPAGLGGPVEQMP